MSVTLYQSSIPVFVRHLDNLSGLLATGLSYAHDQEVDEAVLASARLFPNMHPLVKQVQIACDMVKRGGARLAGVEADSDEDTEVSFAELQDRIAKTKVFLLSLPERAINGAGDKTIVMPAGPYELTFTGHRIFESMGAAQYVFSYHHCLQHPAAQWRLHRQD
jgi:hypothetical protein